ncbi:MAG: 2Fe-2S iron-sulfur cluster binding domain-containing protein [Bacteroidetes bacterium]|jgi:ferredoxin|nr:2Fe-2S iron-sulfur cluster binding domain-containing protein [Bacteroidota bacterium]
MSTHRVEVRNRDHRAVEVSDEEFLLDALEAAGLRLPYGCRYGACVSCAARLLDGAVDQSEGTALRPAQKAEGYVLLCIARPRSDCVIEVGADGQQDLFTNPLKRQR